jgi:outer membrane protein OmpA-like peptidoglycan-associated protein
MNARIASGILLALGTLDLGVLNLHLVPRLEEQGATAMLDPEAHAGLTAAPAAPKAPHAMIPEAADVRVDRWASLETAAPPKAERPLGRATTDVVFAFDSTRLEHLAAIHDLRRLARELADHPDRRLQLRGHADPLGIPDQNVTLSQRRAEAVRDYLVFRGAPADRISVEGIGSNEPADPHQVPSAWAKDRRVEVLWR